MDEKEGDAIPIFGLDVFVVHVLPGRFEEGHNYGNSKSFPLGIIREFCTLNDQFEGSTE